MQDERRFFVIVHKPTGKTLPARGAWRGRGYTIPEPNSFDPPRMFNKHSAASKALAAWLKGKWATEYRIVGDGDYVYATPKITPQAGRVAADMAVVEATVLFGRA